MNTGWEGMFLAEGDIAVTCNHTEWIFCEWPDVIDPASGCSFGIGDYTATEDIMSLEYE